MRYKNRGFTLIELLVAISILAIVAVLGFRGLDSIVRSRASLNADLDQTRGMQLTFAQLQSDCSQNVNSLSYPNIPEHRTSWIESDRLILIRNVYKDDQPPSMQVVVYRLKGTDLTRFQSATTRDLEKLRELLTEARNPPDNQVEVVMEQNVAGIEFTGYPESSLNNISDADYYASQIGPGGGLPPGGRNPQGGAGGRGGTGGTGGTGSTGGTGDSGNSNQSDTIATQNVNKASVTTGLQVRLQLPNHANKISKIFMLGGA